MLERCRRQCEPIALTGLVVQRCRFRVEKCQGFTARRMRPATGSGRRQLIRSLDEINWWPTVSPKSLRSADHLDLESDSAAASHLSHPPI